MVNLVNRKNEFYKNAKNSPYWPDNKVKNKKHQYYAKKRSAFLLIGHSNYSAILTKIYTHTDCFFGDFAHWLTTAATLYCCVTLRSVVMQFTCCFLTLRQVKLRHSYFASTITLVWLPLHVRTINKQKEIISISTVCDKYIPSLPKVI